MSKQEKPSLGSAIPEAQNNSDARTHAPPLR